MDKRGIIKSILLITLIVFICTGCKMPWDSDNSISEKPFLSNMNLYTVRKYRELDRTKIEVKGSFTYKSQNKNTILKLKKDESTESELNPSDMATDANGDTSIGFSFEDYLKNNNEYSFQIWIIDKKGNVSNTLSGSISFNEVLTEITNIEQIFNDSQKIWLPPKIYYKITNTGKWTFDFWNVYFEFTFEDGGKDYYLYVREDYINTGETIYRDTGDGGIAFHGKKVVSAKILDLFGIFVKEE